MITAKVVLLNYLGYAELLKYTGFVPFSKTANTFF